MYLTKRQRLLAEIDPGLAERERAATVEHNRKVRLLDKIDAARAKVAWERNASADRRKEHLIHALERFDRLTAEAVRLGLAQPERKPAA